MSYYIKRGRSYEVTSEGDFDIREKLPVGNYLVQSSMTRGLYLEEIDSFILPDKIYGDVAGRTKRIINTFLDRSESTGVLMTGEKGSGKSLLAKNISVILGQQGIPTLIVNSNLSGNGFNDFIQTIDQECVVLFDEFEKIYDSKGQQEILTLLDGLFATKKLFLLTSNEVHRIDPNMKNRPGRLYYLLKYDGMSVEDAMEYCEDRLENKDHLGKVRRLLKMLYRFNFDMLQALVEEMNRYGEGPAEAMEMLNISSTVTKETYSCKVKAEGLEVKPFDATINITAAFSIDYHHFNRSLYDQCIEDGAEEYDAKYAADGYDVVLLEPEHLVNVKPDTQEYFFEREGVSYHFKLKPPSHGWSVRSYL